MFGQADSSLCNSVNKPIDLPVILLLSRYPVSLVKTSLLHLGLILTTALCDHNFHKRQCTMVNVFKETFYFILMPSLLPQVIRSRCLSNNLTLLMLFLYAK